MSACRMCLAVDARLFTIANTPLQDVYERITDIPLQNGDKKPENVCYLCHHLLRKILAFKERAVTADKLLICALDKGIEITEASMRLIDTSDVCSRLCESRLELLNFVQDQPTGLKTQADVSTGTPVMAEPADVDVEIEVVETSALSLQDEEENIPDFETGMEIMAQDVGGAIKDMNQTVGTSLARAQGDDEVNDLQSSVRVSEKRKLDEDVNKTENTTRLRRDSINIDLNIEYEANIEEPNPLNGAMEPDVMVSISIVKLENESDSEMDNLDIISKNQQENLTELNTQLDSVPKKFAPKKISLCKQCGMSFKSLRLLNSHSRIDHAAAFICNYCSRVFKDKLSLIPHIRKHAGKNHPRIASLKSITLKKINTEKPFRCSYCNESFIEKQLLNDHILTHTAKKPHRCSYCNKIFTRNQHLNEHILIHTGEKPHRCSYCNKKFSRKFALKEHILIHTGKKPHRCSYCKKHFIKKAHLKNHMHLHTGEKPHRCSYCNKHFTQKSNLKAHMVLHTGVKPHRCSHCNKAFSRKCTLNEHVLIHTGKKPHQCSYCNKGFTQKKHLNDHMLIHTGEKPHRCDYCNKVFTQKCNLNTHMLIHTGEKRHQCSCCNKTFSRKFTLNEHMLTHTGEKRHRCSYCDKSFSRRFALNEHMLIHSKEKSN